MQGTLDLASGKEPYVPWQTYNIEGINRLCGYETATVGPQNASPAAPWQMVCKIFCGPVTSQPSLYYIEGIAPRSNRLGSKRREQFARFVILSESGLKYYKTQNRRRVLFPDNLCRDQSFFHCLPRTHSLQEREHQSVNGCCDLRIDVCLAQLPPKIMAVDQISNPCTNRTHRLLDR